MRYSRLERVEITLTAADIARWLRHEKHVPEDFVLDGETDVEWPIKLTFSSEIPQANLGGVGK